MVFCHAEFISASTSEILKQVQDDTQRDPSSSDCGRSRQDDNLKNYA